MTSVTCLVSRIAAQRSLDLSWGSGTTLSLSTIRLPGSNNQVFWHDIFIPVNLGFLNYYGLFPAAHTANQFSDSLFAVQQVDLTHLYFLHERCNGTGFLPNCPPRSVFISIPSRCSAHNKSNQLVVENLPGILQKLVGVSTNHECDVPPSRFFCCSTARRSRNGSAVKAFVKHFHMHFLTSQPKTYLFWSWHLCCLQRSKGHVFED